MKFGVVPREWGYFLDEAIEQVDKLRKMGAYHIVLRLSLRKLPHSKIMESIRLFGEKVIPHFSDYSR